MNYRFAIAAFVLMSAVSVAQAAGNPFNPKGNAEAGKAKAATCAACHGADGNSVVPTFPKLAGQNAPYLMKELHDFKSGARKNPIMTAMVVPLTNQDIDNLAAYYSSQTMSVGTTNKKLAAKGENIFRGGNATTGVAACMACHGPTGAGNPAAHFPRLAGQHAPYIVAQLEAFKNGTRSNDAGMLMRNIAAKLSPGEMKAVAAYIQGLH